MRTKSQPSYNSSPGSLVLFLKEIPQVNIDSPLVACSQGERMDLSHQLPVMSCLVSCPPSVFFSFLHVCPSSTHTPTPPLFFPSMTSHTHPGCAICYVQCVQYLFSTPPPTHTHSNINQTAAACRCILTIYHYSTEACAAASNLLPRLPASPTPFLTDLTLYH